MSNLALICLYLVLGTAVYLLTLAPIPLGALACILLGLAGFGALVPITHLSPAWSDWLGRVGRLVGPVLALRMLLAALGGGA